MAYKLLYFICVQIFLIEIISCQCIPSPDGVAQSLLADAVGISEGLALGSNIAGSNIAIGPNIGLPVGSNTFNNLGMGSNWPVGPASPRLGIPGGISPAAIAPPMGIAASNGGSFTVTSTSPIAPTGLTVNSENNIEGSLIVTGQLPFLGSVSMDGAFPTGGGGMVSYGCGDGNIGMVNEGLQSNPMGQQTLAPTMGYGSGLPGGQINGLPGRGFNGFF